LKKLKIPTNPDSREKRLQWFTQGLFEVSKLESLNSIGIPLGIGCNLGGGIWENYLKVINRFSNYVNQKYNTEVLIYNYHTIVINEFG